MTTRKSKIARLPVALRDELNQRLLDGAEGAQLVVWLNDLPTVRELLAKDFAGRPITEQNLSEWKQGGYEDWLRHQEARDWVRACRVEAAELGEDAGAFSVADCLSPALAVALGRWLRHAAAHAPNDPAQANALLVVAEAVDRVRRGDHRAQSLRLDRERFEMQFCAGFLKWRKNEKANAIAEDKTFDNRAKIALLRKLMFGDRLESGKEEMPEMPAPQDATMGATGSAAVNEAPHPVAAEGPSAVAAASVHLEPANLPAAPKQTSLIQPNSSKSNQIPPMDPNSHRELVGLGPPGPPYTLLC